MVSPAASFTPSSYSDIPLYNIQAVAAATGVPSITLRSWERRYGIPEPKRDPKGYRLYSDRDIAITRWLKERVQQGIGISRAVDMLRALESGRLVPDDTGTFDFDVLHDRLLNAIEHLDHATVSRVIGEALMVAPVEEVALRLLQPVLYDVGEGWASGRLSVTSEHVGSNLLRAQLAQLIRISPAPLREERILVACAPGEQHDIGALMLALFTRRRGFDVIYAGASVEPDSFSRDVRRVQPAAVCVSASLPQAVEALIDLFGALDTGYAGIRAFGGRAFNEWPELADRVPGVLLGRDAGEAVRTLELALRRDSAA